MDIENHPGAQVALTAAAIDSALTFVAPTATNKRTYDEALSTEATLPPAECKRRVTLDGTAKRITLSSSCGSLTSLPLKAGQKTPNSPTCVGSATADVIPSSPEASVAGTKLSSEAMAAPQVPNPTVKTVTKKLTKKNSAASTASSEDSCSPSDAAALVAAEKVPSGSGISIRSGMTPAEKAKACRERNREHARKTRLRKKAYVDELKKSLNEMVEERDAIKAEEEQKAKIMEQNRDVRFQVMQDFLNLRGNNERNPQRWAAILVPEEFSLKLPMTDFQTMVAQHPGAALQSHPQQVLMGVTDVMADASYFSSFLQQSLASKNGDAAAPVSFVYQCDRDSFLMDGCSAVFNFEAESSGSATSTELKMMGQFRAHFCPETNRLRSAQLMFDTGAIHYQISRITAQASTN